MAIKENLCPATMAETVAVNIEDAAARITECLSNYSTGLLGVRFLNIEQFVSAMRECGFQIESDSQAYMTCVNAQTWILCACLKNKAMRFMVHTFGSGDTVQVINCEEIGVKETPLPKTPKVEVDGPPLRRFKY